MMKCSLGPNARIGGVRPETLWAMERAKEVMWYRGYDCTYTSIIDRKHKKNSLHYVGFAFDFNIRFVASSDIHDIADDLASLLGDDFDIVVNMEQKIIHVEFQPEGGLNL